MQYRVFYVPLFDDGTSEDELNRFLRSHRIMDVSKQYSESASAWTFCVTYVDTAIPSASTIQGKKEKIDYKDVLDEQTFARFAKLREARKAIANEEALPAYAVFTNEELAQIAALDEVTEHTIDDFKATALSSDGIIKMCGQKFKVSKAANDRYLWLATRMGKPTQKEGNAPGLERIPIYNLSRL